MRTDAHLISSLQDELNKVKLDLAISAQYNLIQLKKLEAKDEDLLYCMRSLNKLLDAQSTLNHLTSQTETIRGLV